MTKKPLIKAGEFPKLTIPVTSVQELSRHNDHSPFLAWLRFRDIVGGISGGWTFGQVTQSQGSFAYEIEIRPSGRYDEKGNWLGRERMKLNPETHDEKVKRIAERIRGPVVNESGGAWMLYSTDPTKLAELLVEMAEKE